MSIRVAQKADWLKNDGNAYINTLCTIQDSTLQIDIVVKNIGVTETSNCMFFGAKSDFGKNELDLRFQNLKLGVTSEGEVKTIPDPTDGIYNITIIGTIIYCNGSVYEFKERAEILRPIFMFRKNGERGIVYQVAFSLFKIENQINLVPCQLLLTIPSCLSWDRKAHSAGECGMWDTVNNKFFGNAASKGAFSVEYDEGYEDEYITLEENGVYSCHNGSVAKMTDCIRIKDGIKKDVNEIWKVVSGVKKLVWERDFINLCQKYQYMITAGTNAMFGQYFEIPMVCDFDNGDSLELQVAPYRTTYEEDWIQPYCGYNNGTIKNLGQIYRVHSMEVNVTGDYFSVTNKNLYTNKHSSSSRTLWGESFSGESGKFDTFTNLYGRDRSVSMEFGYIKCFDSDGNLKYHYIPAIYNDKKGWLDLVNNKFFKMLSNAKTEGTALVSDNYIE